jgi:hypothetical protein
MGRSVYITTPIPTLEEVGNRLKMSKARQRRLIQIVTGAIPDQSSNRRRGATGPVSERSGSRNGTRKLPASRTSANGTASSKKSKRAAAS